MLKVSARRKKPKRRKHTRQREQKQTVVTYKNPDGASINKLLKSDGEVVTQAELEIGVKNYLEKLKNDKWDGKLPVYYLGSDGSITTVIPTPGV